MRIEVEPAELVAAADMVATATQVLEPAELALRVLGDSVTEWAEDGRLGVAARQLFEALRWACLDGLEACASLEAALARAAGSYAAVEDRAVRR